MSCLIGQVFAKQKHFALSLKLIKNNQTTISLDIEAENGENIVPYGVRPCTQSQRHFPKTRPP